MNEQESRNPKQNILFVQCARLLNQLDKAEAYRQTGAYQKAMRKRSMWVEPLFGEAKESHRLRRFRLRCLLIVNIEGVMVATGQNLKRLIKRKLAAFFFGCRGWPWPVQSTAEL